MTLLAISIRCKLLEYRISNWTRFCHGSWETNVLCLALYYRFVRKANSKIASKVIYLPRIYIFRVSFYLFIVIPFSVLYHYFCSNRYSISCSKLYKIPCRVIITKNRLILTEGIIFTRSSFLTVNLLEASKNLISPFVTWAMWQIRWELLKNQFHPTSLPTRRNTLLIQCWQLQHCPLTPRAWRKKNKAKGGGKRNYREKTKMSKQRRNEHDAASNSFPETFKSKSEAASAILTCRESCQPTSCAHSHCTSSRPATAAGSR